MQAIHTSMTSKFQFGIYGPQKIWKKLHSVKTVNVVTRICCRFEGKVFALKFQGVAMNQS